MFARYLNVSKNLVSDWERGVKKPGGPALRLLTVIQKIMVLPRVEQVNICMDEITDIARHEFAVACTCRGRDDRIEGGHGFALCLGHHGHLCPDLRSLLVKRQDAVFKACFKLLKPKGQFRPALGGGSLANPVSIATRSSS